MIIVKYVAKTLGWKTGGSELSLFLWTLQVGNVVFGIWLNGRKGGGKGDFQGLGDEGTKSHRCRCCCIDFSLALLLILLLGLWLLAASCSRANVIDHTANNKGA